MAVKLIILFHGVGSNGEDLRPIAQYWQREMEGIEIAFPNAPFPFVQSHDVFQWFSMTGVTDENRHERVAHAREYFNRTVRLVLDELEFTGDISEVVFCGFSQGTIMALDAIATARWPVAGVIGFSGRLASVLDPKTSATQSRVMLFHGQDDQVIPFVESEKAYHALQQAGFDVQLEIYRNLGHSVSENEVFSALQFLKTL